LALLVATFFYSGYARLAPGTVASLLTVCLWAVPIWFGVSFVLRLVFAFLLFLIGIWASERALYAFEEQKDPSAIVIDEVAGQTLALVSCSNLISLMVAFALFRFFDILKPGPIGWLDYKLKGALGIMVDDMAAGAAALALLLGAHFFWPAYF
jgi:phosphatidylglycerophosphatase A